MEVLDKIAGQLIVSCHPDASMDIPVEVYIDALVYAVESAGAAGVRIEGIENVRRLRKKTSLPIVGFVRGAYNDGTELITPSAEDAMKLVEAGADIVAVDSTNRKRPSGKDGFGVVEELRSTVTVPLWCDISSFQEGIRCAELGADMVATTLAGFTPGTAGQPASGPDYALIEQLSSALIIPVIAEGRVLTPEDAVQAMKAGAWAVVAGTAITRPSVITKMFVSSLNRRDWGNF